MRYSKPITNQTDLVEFEKGVNYTVDSVANYMRTGSMNNIYLSWYTKNQWYMNEHDWRMSVKGGFYTREERDRAYNDAYDSFRRTQTYYEKSFSQKIANTFGPIRTQNLQILQENDRLKREIEQLKQENYHLINQLKQRNTTSTNHSEAK